MGPAADSESADADPARLASSAGEQPPVAKRPRLGNDTALALDRAASLEEAARALEAAEGSLKQEPVVALTLLRRLPGLLAAEVLRPDTTADALAKRVHAGDPLQTPALPSQPRTRADPGQARLEPFCWVRGALEAALQDAIRDAKDMVRSMEALAVVGVFLERVRLEESLPRSLVEKAASELLHWLRQHWEDVDFGSLGLMCRFARGVACSGALADSATGAFIQHDLVAVLAKTLALALQALPADSTVGVPAAALHDVAVALALARPWPAESPAARAAGALLRMLPKAASLALLGEAPWGLGDGAMGVVAAAHSGAGKRAGAAKENQDSCFAVASANSALGCVIDGHGSHGAAASSAVRRFLQEHLPRLRSGQHSKRVLRDLFLLADISVLVGAADTRLCGAACAVVYLAPDAGAAAAHRIVVAHAGDCRVILGRKKGAEWKVLRLTKDHVVTDPSEVARVIAAGGCVKCAKPKVGYGATDVVGLGPPRLWSRLLSAAPGLAVSRGLGDALAQSCGLSAEAETLEATLGSEDLVLVAASDGVFDVLPDQEVLQRCLPYRRARDAAGAAAAVVAASGKAWDGQSGGSYCDDMSCVVFFL